MQGISSEEENNYFDPIVKEPTIKVFWQGQAIQVIDDLQNFAMSRGETELLEVIAPVAAKLENCKLVNEKLGN